MYQKTPKTTYYLTFYAKLLFLANYPPHNFLFKCHIECKIKICVLKNPQKRHHTRFFTLNHYFLLINPPFHSLPLNRIRSKTIRTVLLRIPTCVPNLKLIAQLLQKLSRELTDRPTDRQNFFLLKLVFLYVLGHFKPF